MKDIDFDELDRAVSSLMKTTPSSAATDTDEAPTTPELPMSDDAVEESLPVVDLDTPSVSSESELSSMKEPEEEPVEVKSPPSDAIPAARRGRFMDVMRPSNRDMKKPSLSNTYFRQGVTLQPSSPIVQPDVPSIEPSVEQPNSEPVLEESNPFDFSLGVESTGGSEGEAGETSDETAPLSSPFLPDAKVEKRPLGRSADMAPAVDMMSPSPEVVNEEYQAIPATDKDAQLPEQPLPPELDSKLLSIETAGENLMAEVQPVSAPTIEQEPAVTPTEPTPPAPSPLIPPSIPQQYQVQPPKEDEAPAGAIYDSQPLAHPAKKTPGWVWIVGIIAIILLGVGGGAAVYYLGLI